MSSQLAISRRYASSLQPFHVPYANQNLGLYHLPLRILDRASIKPLITKPLSPRTSNSRRHFPRLHKLALPLLLQYHQPVPLARRMLEPRILHPSQPPPNTNLLPLRLLFRPSHHSRTPKIPRRTLHPPKLLLPPLLLPSFSLRP